MFHIFNVIEYPDTGKWFLTVGKKAPWDNFHIEVPFCIAKELLKIINSRKSKQLYFLEW